MRSRDHDDDDGEYQAPGGGDLFETSFLPARTASLSIHQAPPPQPRAARRLLGQRATQLAASLSRQ